MTAEVIHTTVFHDGERGGNPCPVVLDAHHLTEEEMMDFSAHFGQETAFVLPAEHGDHDWRFRFFMPSKEVGMCIHGTIGALTVLLNREDTVAPSVKIETGVGVVDVEWTKKEDGYTVRVEQYKPVIADTNPSYEEVCRALQINKSDLAADLPLQLVSTSRQKLLVPLKREGILESLQPDFKYMWELCDRYQTSGFYPFTFRADGEVQARQFPNRAGYLEDPATGVAACALGAYLSMQDGRDTEAPEWKTYLIHQGREMGRPSVMQAEVYRSSKGVLRTFVRGKAKLETEWKAL
ncbi:PhzF family phenazine biosynthesis isomerase [Halobacillus sp. ACCC02827]|uniref:PhzF family phenazine biosynthesis protein n=1 Tax=Halobacillus sp. ACCC02827 TaxID=3052090 RepID=UPI0025701D3B|nr:PhzF family phenazine biosynthesis isomerase [Halobacillus sp. ACCC02827]WJE16468.1 PhzF family phenazine biosynthesis isomerase [Halobacillus sp. ACCC02827]